MKLELGFAPYDSSIDESLDGGCISICGLIKDGNKVIYILSDDYDDPGNYKFHWSEEEDNFYDDHNYHNFPYEGDEIKLTLSKLPEDAYDLCKILVEIKEEK